MKFIIVNLINLQNIENIISKISDMLKNEFIIYFILECDVLKLQKVESLIHNLCPNCEMLDKRVVTSEMSTVRQFAVGFSSVKTNRLVFQSAKTIEDIKALLKLNLVNKNQEYIEINI